MSKEKNTEAEQKPMCGIIMPISDTPGYRSGHWQDVVKILQKAIDEAGFEGKIVSDSEVSNVIQNEIIRNIADNSLIICDTSSNNPNVMFELGLRLAFDKPTIIIKDFDTKFNFDLGPIRHIEYPKDLRFTEVLDFHQKLVKAIKATSDAYNKGEYKTYLQSFTIYKPKLEQEEISLKEYLDLKIDQLSQSFQGLKTNIDTNTRKNKIHSTELAYAFNNFMDAIPNKSNYIKSPRGEQFDSFVDFLRIVEPRIYQSASYSDIMDAIDFQTAVLKR